MKLTFAGHDVRLSGDDETRYRDDLARVAELVADEPEAKLHRVFWTRSVLSPRRTVTQ